jgi:DNA-binding NarL/FixJ family response regulator
MSGVNGKQNGVTFPGSHAPHFIATMGGIAMEAIREIFGNKHSEILSTLLVDDNPTFLRIATRILREYCYDEVSVVGTVSGSSDAFERASSLKPRIILLGLNRLGVVDKELISQLRSVLPDVKIIALGPLDKAAYRQAALDAGADAFVAKVNLSNDLLPTIQRLTNRTRISDLTHKVRFPVTAMEWAPVV